MTVYKSTAVKLLSGHSCITLSMHSTFLPSLSIVFFYRTEKVLQQQPKWEKMIAILSLHCAHSFTGKQRKLLNVFPLNVDCLIWSFWKSEQCCWTVLNKQFMFSFGLITDPCLTFYFFFFNSIHMFHVSSIMYNIYYNFFSNDLYSKCICSDVVYHKYCLRCQ